MDRDIENLMQILIRVARKFPLSTIQTRYHYISLTVQTSGNTCFIMITSTSKGFQVRPYDMNFSIKIDDTPHTTDYDTIEKAMERICVLVAKLPAWVLENPGQDFPRI